MSIEKNNIEPLLPILPMLRTPDSKIYSEDEIKRFQGESRTIVKEYNRAIVKENMKLGEAEILDKILMISDELKKVDYLEELKRDGDNTLNELTMIHQFIKNMNIGDDGKLEITIKTLTSGSLHIKSEYATYSILNFISSLNNPEIERKKGGQTGTTVKNRIIKGFARDLRFDYMRNFKSVKLTYSFIIDILSAAGFETSYSNLKTIIRGKD